MLTVNRWSTAVKELDFSSAGLSNKKVHSIHLDGELLCNAYELTEWEAENDRMQLTICDNCGTIHCQSGGWVTFRRVGEDVFVLPLFSEILSDDDWAHPEYYPPYLIRKRGVLLFDRDIYSKFRESFPKFPEYGSIPPITHREALLTFQLEVPGRLLGDIYKSPNDIKRLELVLTASEGDPTELTKQVCRVLDEGLSDERLAHISNPEPEETTITLYIDLPGFPEWNVFWKGKGIELYLSPKHRLKLIEGSK